MTKPGKKASKMTEVILYLATRTNQQATYSQLYREFVEKRGWAKNTLNKYLSLLHQRRVITRSWLSYTDSLNRLRKFRVYRLNKDYFREAQWLTCLRNTFKPTPGLFPKWWTYHPLISDVYPYNWKFYPTPLINNHRWRSLLVLMLVMNSHIANGRFLLSPA